MKKLLAVCLLASMSAAAFADFSVTSVRMQGINPNLVGIIEDEYSDPLSINPADLLNVSGYRVFTNLSNLYGGGNLGADRAFGGTTTGGIGLNQFLLGGFGNPLGDILPDSQMGLLYNSGSNLMGAINTLGFTGDRKLDTVTQGDTNNDGDYTDVGDWTRVDNQRANREISTFGTDYNALFSMNLLGLLKFGANIFYDDADINGNPSSEEPITGSHYRRLTTIGTPSNIVTTHNYSLDAKETNKNSTIRANLGTRFRLLDDKLNVGAVLGIVSTSRQRVRASTAKVSIDLSQTAGAIPGDPITAEATAVDGNLVTLPGGFGLLPGAVTNGFDWTGGMNWGGFSALGWLGITGNEIGTAKSDGTGINIGADSYYKLTDALKLVGRVNIQSVPQKLTGALSLPYSNVYFSSAANVAGGRSKTTENDNTTYSVSGDIANNTVGITLGGEAELKNNVTLGFGAIYTMVTAKTDGGYTRSRKDVSTFDGDNDGEVVNDTNDPLDTDNRTTVEDTDTATFVNENKTDTLQIPIGLEMRVWRKFSTRLGVTHQIQAAKATNTTKVINDGLIKTTVESNGVAPVTYEGTGAGKNTGQETTTVTNSITRTTQYYYGIGYDWSENLSFDILGVSGMGSGAGILDLASWRISATLKF